MQLSLIKIFKYFLFENFIEIDRRGNELQMDYNGKIQKIYINIYFKESNTFCQGLYPLSYTSYFSHFSPPTFFPLHSVLFPLLSFALECDSFSSLSTCHSFARVSLWKLHRYFQVAKIVTVLSVVLSV